MSSKDPSGPRFFALMVMSVGFVITFIAATEGEGGPVVAGTFMIGCIGVIILVTSIALEDRNWGRGRTTKSKFYRVLAYVLSMNVRDCGCAYGDGLGNTSPGSDWAEKETVWIREMDDARVRFVKAETGLKRCHKCGKHYSETERKTGRIRNVRKTTSHECWPAEEPQLRDSLNYRVIEAGTEY